MGKETEEELDNWIDQTAKAGEALLSSGEAEKLLKNYAARNKRCYKISEIAIKQRAEAARRPRKRKVKVSCNDSQDLILMLIELGRDFEKVFEKWIHKLLLLIEKKMRDQKRIKGE